jgi:hypothetical protein
MKHLPVRIFLNLANGVYYLQLSDCLVPVKEKLATLLAEKLQLEIIRADDTKAMQLICQ